MFQYYGNIQGLREELESFRELLTTAYKNLLGEELYLLVGKAETAFINQNSFVEIPRQECGFDCVQLPKSAMQIALEKNQIATTYIKQLFLLSEEGCKKFSEPTGLLTAYLPAYIHCFNNFIVYLIQKIPMVFALRMISDRFYSSLSDSALSSFEEKIIEDAAPGKIAFINQSEDRFKIGNFDEQKIAKLIKGELCQNVTPEQLVEDTALFCSGILINATLTASTLAMDRQIFLEMGLDISRYPRRDKNLIREIVFNHPKLEGNWRIGIGDTLEGYSFQKRLLLLAHWLNQLGAISDGADEFVKCQQEFFQMLSFLYIVKM